MTKATYLFLIIVLIGIEPRIARGATINVTCTGSGTPLQAAVDSALPGDVIQVTGDCLESVLVRNEKQRIAIDGGGNATIQGTGNTIPTFNVRGKGILIQNFANIQTGSACIHVNRGSNAVIHNNNTIQACGAGIAVDQMSFAVITGNTITSSVNIVGAEFQGHGIVISGNSTARIGFNTGRNGAIPNTIVQNADAGIFIERNSHAWIRGNQITNNFNGIALHYASQAEIDNNNISGNASNGILLTTNSGAVLSLNSSTTNNTGFGVRCSGPGGYVQGSKFTLSGGGLAQSEYFDPGSGCLDFLN
jgi:parallel beta-helix repeat protein